MISREFRKRVPLNRDLTQETKKLFIEIEHGRSAAILDMLHENRALANLPHPETGRLPLIAVLVDMPPEYRHADRLNIADYLWWAGANLNAQISAFEGGGGKEPLLFYCVRKNHFYALAWLLDHHANHAMRNGADVTPFDVAIALGSEAACRHLFLAGACLSTDAAPAKIARDYGFGSLAEAFERWQAEALTRVVTDGLQKPLRSLKPLRLPGRTA